MESNLSPTIVFFGVLTSVLVFSVLAVLVYLTITLIKANQKLSLRSENLLVGLLSQEKTLNQSLVNQVRTTTVETLHGLNAGTLTSSALEEDDAQISQEQRDLIAHQNSLTNAGLAEQDTDDEFGSRGWAPALTDTEGTPSVFS